MGAAVSVDSDWFTKSKPGDGTISGCPKMEWWFEGKSAGNPCVHHKTSGFPVDVWSREEKQIIIKGSQRTRFHNPQTCGVPRRHWHLCPSVGGG